MNKSLYMLMAGAMIFGAAELSAQTKNADPVQEKLKAVYSKAEQLFRSNFPGSGFASYSDDGILGAMKEYQEALKIEGLSNMQKIELHKRIANCCLEVMDVEKANAELQKAAALPGLDEKEKFAANENLADAYRRELDYEKVIPAYLNLLNG